MSNVEVIVLGIAQDAGVPQLGCRCPRCVAAHEHSARRRYATALGIIDRVEQKTWLVEATPQIVEQSEILRSAAPKASLDGVLITHAHMGHVLGLAHVGREAAATSRLPVFVTRAMASWLSSHAPWSELVRLDHIRLSVIEPGRETGLSASIRVEAIRVPHRDEFADTVAWSIAGPARRLFFCPDIDAWDAWDLGVEQVVSSHDVSLLDGSFFDETEVPERRDRLLIPHPCVRETMGRLSGASTDVRFIHLNHTNPLLDDGEERALVKRRGFSVATRGDRIPLG